MKTSKRKRISGHGRGNGGRVIRLGAVALIVLMLAMAAMPFSPNSVSAANNDIKLSSSSNVRVTDLQVQPGETPDDPMFDEVDDLVVVTKEPTLADPIAVGAVQINKLGCEEDYDGDYYQLAANCWPMDAPFTVSSSVGESAYNGSFTDEQVGAGYISITESIPDGYGEPWIFCDGYFADGSESGFSQYWSSEGELQHELQPGEWFYCDWFNVPGDFHAEEENDGSIYINKHDCPLNYDATDKDYYDLAADCQGTMNGVKFDLTVEGNPVQSESTGDEIESAVNFEELFPGDYEVTEEIPAGYDTPVVFCTNHDVTGAELAQYYQADVLNGSTELTLNEGEYIFCDWFNFPSDHGGITIQKWECPEGLAFAVEPTLEDYLAACTGYMNGVEFELSYPDDDLALGQIKTTGDDGDGTVIFGGVQPGNIVIAEEIPSGYGDPVVFCGWGAIYDADGEGGNPPIAIDGIVPLQSLPGGVLEQEMYPNEGMYCDWFNFPHYDGEIDIYKWECPVGFDAYDANLDELMVECDQAMSGIDFTLNELGDGGQELVGIENTDADGFAGFDNVEAGNYTLTEAMPTGYGTPIVYCYELEGEAVSYDVYEGTIELHNNEYGKIVCFWFNIPYDGGSITIYKYTCPAGYDLYAWNADPEHDCTDQTNGIDFTLYGDSIGSQVNTTGDWIFGAAYWGGLEYDDYVVAEDVPAGIYQTWVACQWSEDLGPYYYEQFAPYTNGDYAVGNRIDLELHKGSDITCWWYNVPEDYDGGDLVVIKYWCDGHIYDEAHCELYGGGADFGLVSASGEGDPVFFSTGWDGTAHLYLPAGNYDLFETGRQWCKAESDQVNGNGEVVIYDGETSYVTVYNCGPGKEKEPPVKKFPNTGAGTLTMTNSVGFSGTFLMIVAGGTVLLLGVAGASMRDATVAQRNELIG